MSLGQLCFLCSIPNNPTLYNPLKNFDNTVKRKNRILDQMLDDGVITKVDYDEAYQEEIKLNIQEVQKRDYIQTFVSYCAIRELMKKNGFEFKNSFADKEERETYETEYDDAYSTAQQMLLNKGYKIYTSFDLKKQKKLQKAVNHNLSGFKDKETNGTYKMQGSAVCIDNKTGRVAVSYTHLQKDDRVYKGETEITSDYRVLDDIKNDTGADVTVFVGDERCLTTLVDKKGNRLVGSHIDKEVASQVIEGGEEYFSQNVDVMGVRYFGYYVPIRNDENEVVGVSFAGESAESVNTSMRFMTQGNVIICLFIIILAGFICNLSAQKMVEAIQAIKRFLGRVSHGERCV